MKLFLWTKKWLQFLITQFFFALVCVIINFIDLSLNRFGKILMLRIDKCVQHFLWAINVYFCASVSWTHFMGF